MVQIVIPILTYIVVVKFTKAELTGNIIGGEFSKLSDFPYSVFVHIRRDDEESFCSGSILNQALILTAAHCVSPNMERRLKIMTYTGSVKKRKGFVSKVASFRTHEYYNDFTLQSDVAVLQLKNRLTLGKDVKKIIVMNNPPKVPTAVVAGWGVYNELGIISDVLRHSRQRVLDKDTCNNIVKDMPLGTLCAREQRYPDKGDSGSALVIEKNSIQIGIVSFKKRPYSNHTIVYTDVAFYEHWIRNAASDMYCGTSL